METCNLVSPGLSQQDPTKSNSYVNSNIFIWLAHPMSNHMLMRWHTRRKELSHLAMHYPTNLANCCLCQLRRAPIAHSIDTWGPNPSPPPLLSSESKSSISVDFGTCRFHNRKMRNWRKVLSCVPLRSFLESRDYYQPSKFGTPEIRNSKNIISKKCLRCNPWSLSGTAQRQVA